MANEDFMLDDRIGQQLTADTIRKMICFMGSSMNDYLFVYDYETDLYSISSRALERFCLPSSEFSDAIQNLMQVVYPEDISLLKDDLADLHIHPERTTHDLLYRWMSIEGKPIWVNCRARVVRKDGKLSYMVGCINEVGRTQQQADNKSGLLGPLQLRKLLMDHLPTLPEGFFLRIRIDDLKGIHARLGMEYGDQLIALVASLVVKECAEGQNAYYMNDNDLMIVDFNGGTLKQAEALYNRLCVSIRESMAEQSNRVLLTISAGCVCCCDIHEQSFSAVMRLTEFVIGETKLKGKNCFCQFVEADYQAFVDNQKIELLLTHAVQNNMDGFEVYYQPLYSVGHKSINGAEGLLRFHTKEYGMLSPDRFIPILERTCLIVPVGRWVLREVCTACAKMQTLLSGFHIGINISAVQIMKSPFWEDFMQIVQEMQVDPACIICELTESEELECDNRILHTCKHIKSLNVPLALDDFGSGYSNFRYLSELMPVLIKVDRQFIEKAVSNQLEFKLLNVFCEMAHTLGIEIVVEGVETEDELEVAYLVSADYIQGFYFGRPASFAQLYEMVEARGDHNKKILFPKLLYDQNFISSVVTGDYSVMMWINLKNGLCKTLKKRTKLPFPDDTLSRLVDNIIDSGMLDPQYEKQLRRYTDPDYIRAYIEAGNRKIEYWMRMKVLGEYKWTQMELIAPPTYSEDFPFVLLAWRKADQQYCLREEAIRMRGMVYRRILKADLADDSYLEISLSDIGLDPKPGESGSLSKWLNGFAQAGMVNAQDLDTYLSFTDQEKVKRRFAEGEKRLCARCRLNSGRGERWYQLEWIAVSPYNEQYPKAMLYILDIQDEIEQLGQTSEGGTQSIG